VDGAFHRAMLNLLGFAANFGIERAAFARLRRARGSARSTFPQSVSPPRNGALTTINTNGQELVRQSSPYYLCLKKIGYSVTV
jgi:hypothetical protein